VLLLEDIVLILKAFDIFGVLTLALLFYQIIYSKFAFNKIPEDTKSRAIFAGCEAFFYQLNFQLRC